MSQGDPERRIDQSSAHLMAINCMSNRYGRVLSGLVTALNMCELNVQLLDPPLIVQFKKPLLLLSC